MDNKLSERSKPLYLRCVDRGTGETLYTPCGKDYPRGKGYYSQEYVSALQHESAVNWEAATSLVAVNEELKHALEAKDNRIAELERARFIAWPGNMFAPVLARIKVDVKRRDGSVSVGQSGGNVVWYHQDRPDDVVAFALTEEGEA